MKRRDFIKTSLYAGVGASLSLSKFGFLMNAPAEAVSEHPDLVMIKNGSPRTLVEIALKTLGGIECFVSRGDVVLVKPNIGWDRTPAQAANTHPAVVKALVRECLKMEPKVVKILDFTCNDPRRCYIRSGIRCAIEQIEDPRARLLFVDKRRFIKIRTPEALNLKEWTYYRDALEADKLINVPQAKHHGLTRLSLGMKNMMGVIGPNRGIIHQKIHHNLVDINNVIHSHLTIVDATRILVRNGPTGGNLADVEQKKTIIAGINVVSADSAAAQLFGIDWSELEWLRLAREAGLGEPDISKIKTKAIDLRAMTSL